MLSNALDLKDLRVPPANRLEQLKRKRKGQYSIRINDPYRICFIWNDGKIMNVEIVDYH
jgi:proteic killer suppression protein